MKMEDNVLQVSVDDIIPNRFQPRLAFDEQGLKELASSIKEHGIIQPLVLRKLGSKYEIIAGERRYKASIMAGLTTVPAVISNIDDNSSAEIALVENIQRRNLTPIEEANAYKNIIEQIGYTQKDLADRIGKSRSYVTNVLGLLNLPENIQKMILDGDISMGHARVLSKLEDEKRIQYLASLIITKGLSVRQIEELGKQEKKVKQIKTTEKNPHLKKYEKSLEKRYGYQVSIKNNRVTFKCDDEEKIKELISKLMGE